MIHQPFENQEYNKLGEVHGATWGVGVTFFCFLNFIS